MTSDQSQKSLESLFSARCVFEFFPLTKTCGNGGFTEKRAGIFFSFSSALIVLYCRLSVTLPSINVSGQRLSVLAGRPLDCEKPLPSTGEFCLTALLMQR